MGVMDWKNSSGRNRVMRTASIRPARGAEIAIGLLFLIVISLAGLVAAAERFGEEPSTAPIAAAAVDWKQVEQRLGKTGSMQPGEVYKVGLRRRVLQVSI